VDPALLLTSKVPENVPVVVAEGVTTPTTWGTAGVEPTALVPIDSPKI
jgi:hypothetical protein